MAGTSIRLPNNFPVPDRMGYGDTQEESRSRVNMEIGPVRQRRRSRTSPRLFTVQWKLTQSQFQEFDIWYQEILQGGSKQFDIQLLDDDSSLVWYTVEMPEVPKWKIQSESSDNWVVEATLRAPGRYFLIRDSGTDKLIGRCAATLRNTGALKVSKTINGRAAIGISATRGRLNLGIYTRGNFGLTSRGRLTVGYPDIAAPNGMRPVMEMGGILYAANTVTAVSSSNGGDHYDLARDDGSRQVFTDGTRAFDALLGTQRLAIGWNIQSNYSGMIVGTDDPTAATTIYDMDSFIGEDWYDDGYPRTDANEVIGVGALYSDGTYYYVVGRLALNTQTVGNMYLYRADTDLEFIEQGLLEQDPADPNELTFSGFGSFNSNWFTPNSRFDSVYNVSSRLYQFSGRWFLGGATAVYYTDNTDALTGWLRCPTGLDEGSSGLVSIRNVIQVGSTLLTGRNFGGANTVSASTDNGETWTASSPLPSFAEINEFVAFGSTALIYYRVSNTFYVAIASAPFTSWIHSALVGIEVMSPPAYLGNFVVTSFGIAARTNYGPGFTYSGNALVFSTDGITFTRSHIIP